MKAETNVHEAFIAELDAVRVRGEMLLGGETPLKDKYPPDMQFDRAVGLVNGLAAMRRDLSRALLLAELYVGQEASQEALARASKSDG